MIPENQNRFAGVVEITAKLYVEEISTQSVSRIEPKESRSEPSMVCFNHFMNTIEYRLITIKNKICIQNRTRAGALSVSILKITNRV